MRRFWTWLWTYPEHGYELEPQLRPIDCIIWAGMIVCGGLVTICVLS